MSLLIRDASKGLNTREIARRLFFTSNQTLHELLSHPPIDFELQCAVHLAWKRLTKPPLAATTVRGQVFSSPEDQKTENIYETVCDLLFRRGLYQYMHEDFLSFSTSLC